MAGTTGMAAQNIDEVVDGLAEIVREATDAGDRVGYFAALYRQVTVEIRKAIHAGQFEDGPRMDRFDTLFGNRYFAAYDAWRRDRSGPRCWRETFGLLDDGDTVIVQHLVLGVNAHINLDLAVAAARTSPGADIHALQHDYLLVNDILAGVVLVLEDSVGAVSPSCPCWTRSEAARTRRSWTSASSSPGRRPGTTRCCWRARRRRSARSPSNGLMSGLRCSRG